MGSDVVTGTLCIYLLVYLFFAGLRLGLLDGVGGREPREGDSSSRGAPDYPRWHPRLPH